MVAWEILGMSAMAFAPALVIVALYLWRGE
jgi:hypothetical protein